MKFTQRALVGLLLLSCSQFMFATDPPHLIPFQGHLARPAAGDPAKFEPVPAGRYDVLFTLYASPVGGESKVWGPERHSQLTVVNGLVNAMLGSVIGFDAALATDPNLFARPLYVGITVDTDGNPATADLELLPRQVLVPSVYAMNANKLDGYDWHDAFANGNPTTTILSSRIANQSITAAKLVTNLVDSLVPAGTVVSFAGTTPPPGWLLCQGELVSRSVYSNLFAVIGTTYGAGNGTTTFKLPDLRGRTVIGVQQGDPDFPVLNATGGEKRVTLSQLQMPTHSHYIRSDRKEAGMLGLEANELADSSDSGGFALYGPFQRIAATQDAGGSDAHNNLPPFLTLNYLIKY